MIKLTLHFGFRGPCELDGWDFDCATKNKALSFSCFYKKHVNLEPQEPLPRESLHENEVNPEESRAEQWRVQVPKQPLSPWIQPYLKPNSTILLDNILPLKNINPV